MDITYRRANITDLNNLCNLWQQLDESHQSYHSLYLFGKNHKKFRRNFIRRQIINSKVIIYLALADNLPVGFGVGKIESHPPVFQIKKIGTIKDLYVLAKYRNRGIATQITKLLLDELLRFKVTYIELKVDVRNSSAIKLYKKLGFKEFQVIMVK